MITQLKNMDTAFRHFKLFGIIFMLACLSLTCFAIYKSFQAASLAGSRIYILANGKAMEAMEADRTANVPVEARDHIRSFHQYFFTLDPDEQVITANIGKALYLADESARTQYNDLKEKSYYNNLISGNISQRITIDSIQLDLDRHPYYFKCFARQELIRSSSTTNRSLITQGNLRSVARSDNNRHGFLIEHWETLENRDIVAPNAKL